MKKILFAAIVLLAGVINISAQTTDNNEEVHRVYCELLGTGKLFSKKVSVSIDFGQAQKLFDNNTIVDENGKKIEFNSMVDAMNFMGERGWKFEQAYVVTLGTGVGAENVYHWLLSKDIVGNDIQAGLLTKTQYKRQNKE